MARNSRVIKIAAVLNAVLLVGAYVGYRAGVVQAFASSPPADDAAKSAAIPERAPKQELPAHSAQTSVDAFPVTPPQPQASTPRDQFTVSTIGSISMSSPVEFRPRTPIAETTPKTQETHRMIMGGSKSSAVDFLMLSPKPEQPNRDTADAMGAQQSVAPRRKVLMSGSKSEHVSFDTSDEPAPAVRK